MAMLKMLYNPKKEDDDSEQVFKRYIEIRRSELLAAESSQVRVSMR